MFSEGLVCVMYDLSSSFTMLLTVCSEAVCGGDWFTTFLSKSLVHLSQLKLLGSFFFSFVVLGIKPSECLYHLSYASGPRLLLIL
jgi:hypothetical protein